MVGMLYRYVLHLSLSRIAHHAVVPPPHHNFRSRGHNGYVLPLRAARSLTRHPLLRLRPGVLLFALPHAYSRERQGFARDSIQQRNPRMRAYRGNKLANAPIRMKNSSKHMVKQAC